MATSKCTFCMDSILFLGYRISGSGIRADEQKVEFFRVHFFPCKRTTDVVHVTQLFFGDIFRLHGLPLSIVSDRDSRFLGNFWRALWCLANNELNFISVYHPQTGGQTEVVNRSLGNMLRCLVGDNLKSWDMKLNSAEFAHNLAVNRSRGFCLFLVVYGVLPRAPIDLVTLLLAKPHDI